MSEQIYLMSFKHSTVFCCTDAPLFIDLLVDILDV